MQYIKIVYPLFFLLFYIHGMVHNLNIKETVIPIVRQNIKEMCCFYHMVTVILATKKPLFEPSENDYEISSI